MAYSALFKLDSRDLHSEAEVETRLLAPLFKNLGYPHKSIVPKDHVPHLVVQSGTRKVPVQVDFILKAVTGSARVVVEAKKPKESLADAWGQAAGYALSFNRDKEDNERIKWLLISNGHLTSLYQHDSGIATLTLRLTDFVSGSPLWAKLRSYIKFQNADPAASAALAFDVVSPDELNKLFDQAHQLIWKKQKLAPQDAFFEFCKFIFLKITEDKNRRDDAKHPGELFPLTTPWLNALSSSSAHPVRDILFAKLRKDLDDKIAHGKKRIYEPNETLKLTAETCRELIKRFERVDLSSIDEDLNGRMFEVFLNEAVRGKDLGQYFTPRPLVEFMTRLGLFDFGDAEARPKIIDPCCGTAGFLIEAMAFEVSDARNAQHLTPIQRSRLIDRIKNETLFGCEANERVSRVARINMYLHGDGGSHIFNGDGLDNDPQVADDMSAEQKDEVGDCIASIQESAFDLVLTNPPFSMAYSTSAPDEERIIRQLAIEDFALADGADGEDESPLDANKIKSNILFLFRSHRLLKPGGQILIVVDDTILNGETCQPVRDWILKNFVVLGIHSLPFNAFFKARANIKTSAIHLKKKEGDGDQQGTVFMSISNNIGHDNALNDTPHRNNLNDVFNAYSEWRRTGRFSEVLRRNQDRNENLECPEQIFLVKPKALSPTRLDAFYYAPELSETRSEITKLASAGAIKIKTGSDIPRAAKITKKERAEFAATGKVLKYIEIGDVTDYGLIVAHRTGTIDELPSRGQYQIQKGDILVAINNSSRGTVVLVPEQFDGTICTSGFFVLRPKTEDEGLLLWFSLRSELCRRQIYYLAQTASQPELKIGAWDNDFLIPIPQGRARGDALTKAREFQSHIANLLAAANVRFMPEVT